MFANVCRVMRAALYTRQTFARYRLNYLARGFIWRIRFARASNVATVRRVSILYDLFFSLKMPRSRSGIKDS